MTAARAERQCSGQALQDRRQEQAQEVDQDGMKFVITRGAPPSMSQLKASLNEMKGLYEDKFGHEVDEELDQDGTKFRSSSSLVEQPHPWPSFG